MALCIVWSSKSFGEGVEYCIPLFYWGPGSLSPQGTLWRQLSEKKLLSKGAGVSRSGQCGPICATNVLQAIFATLGKPPLTNPDAFANEIGTSGGALSWYETLLFKSELPKHISHNFTLESKILRSYYELEMKGSRGRAAEYLQPIEQIAIADLIPSEREFKVVGGILVGENGTHLGLHYTVFTRGNGRAIQIQDANEPNIIFLTDPRSVLVKEKDLSLFFRIRNPWTVYISPSPYQLMGQNFYLPGRKVRVAGFIPTDFITIRLPPIVDPSVNEPLTLPKKSWWRLPLVR